MSHTGTKTPTAEQPRPVPAARLTSSHRALADALALADFAIHKRPVMPVLGGVLIDTDGESATLHTYDFEVAVSVRLPSADGAEGLSVLPHAELRKVLAGVAAGESKANAARIPVTIDHDTLETPDLAVPLHPLPREEYPALPAQVPATVSVDGQEFIRQLTRVLPAVGTEADLPPVLCAVRIEIGSDTVRLNAVDRYRATDAVVAAQPTKDHPHKVLSALCPGEVLQKLAKRLRAHDGPIGLGIRPGTASSCNPGVIGLTVGDMALTVRPTEGEAPAFDRMFRNDVHASITIDRADMVRATKKADAIGRAQGNTGPLAIRWDENGAMAVAPPSDAENRHRVRGMKVPTTTEDGTPGTPNGQLLHLNPRFLLDLLSTFDGNTVTMHLHAPREEHPTEVTKTVLFTNGPDPRGDGYRHLLQPVQLH